MGIKITKLGVPPLASGQKLKIYEGKYFRYKKGNLSTKGTFHLIMDLNNFHAKTIFPAKLNEPGFLKGCDQALAQGRMMDGTDAIKRAKEAIERFREAGKLEMGNFIERNPSWVFLSDASNYPCNEGHFAIADGKLLPLPPGSDILKGSHWVLKTHDGNIDFALVNLEDPDSARSDSIRSVGEGFFVHKIIHEGWPIDLLNEVPGTGQRSISDCRGNIGQFVNEAKYPEMNSEEKAKVNAELLNCLRDPQKYARLLSDIINGRCFNFGKNGNIPLELNTYNHTYWIKTVSGNVHCLKTYPDPEERSPTGVTFSGSPYLIIEIAKLFDFWIEDAFIGTSGRDVRMIIQKDDKPELISSAFDGTLLWKTPLDPLPNFIAFLEKKT